MHITIYCQHISQSLTYYEIFKYIQDKWGRMTRKKSLFKGSIQNLHYVTQVVYEQYIRRDGLPIFLNQYISGKKKHLNSLIVIPLFRYLKGTSLKGSAKIFLIIKNGLSNWCTSCLIFNHKILLCTVGQQYKIILIHFYGLH